MSVVESSGGHGANQPSMSDRAFGLVLGLAFAAAGTLPLLHARPVRPPFLWLASVLWILGTLAPRVLHRPKQGWLAVTTRIGKVVQFLLMGILFYGVITPVALGFALFGRDSLRRRWEPESGSYWIRRDEFSDMKQQF